ncbi:MAG: NAD-dependent epimerase/dehydratase family protein [Gallionella sp.]|nr:NAD-dependent epimerase/dehydratase family protein [Gallionella sp.]
MRVLLTGASSQIGLFLIPRLLQDGHELFAISRRWRRPGGSAEQGDDGVQWLLDDASSPNMSWPPVDVLIHIAPLRLLPGLLPDFLVKGGRRVIGFGTTSRYSKAVSVDPEERAFAAEQIAAESKVTELCEAAKAAWTVFRPTLIYGAGMDRNVAVIARIIRRCGLFPLFGAASGRRQPVHADDLATACIAALAEPKAFNSAYDLAGGETLTYREMVERIFAAEGRTPHFLPVPLAAFRAAMWCVSRIPRFKDFNAEMARRMNQDLVFDSSDAVLDFRFTPRKFEPEPLRPDSG